MANGVKKPPLGKGGFQDARLTTNLNTSNQFNLSLFQLFFFRCRSCQVRRIGLATKTDE